MPKMNSATAQGKSKSIHPAKVVAARAAALLASAHRKSPTEMLPMPERVHGREELRARTARWRAAGESIALVPTMGALHEGHLALVRRAAELAPHVVVSIFVNPTQFAPNEDFGRYPRTLEADVAALEATPAELVYAPDAETMYPEGFSTRVVPQGGPADGLESITRPHFFGGVATIVTKLFNQVQPDIALFGEKDYQQLRVVERMARDLDLGVRVIGVPTLRESDGLALSSRNRYLSFSERHLAPVLHRALADAAAEIAGGAPIAAVLAEARRALDMSGFTVDYFEARHAETLAPIASAAEGPIRLLTAAKLGSTRLIDNLAVPAPAH